MDGLVISPDSARIAFRFRPEGSWSYEIGVLEAASGAMEPLTHNDRTDYLGGWSRDSAIVYTSLEEGGATQFYRTYAHPLP